MCRRITSALVVVAVVMLFPHPLPAAEEIKVEGSISKIDGEMLTVKSAQGDRTLRVEPATKIMINGKPGSPMDLKVGQRVKCVGESAGGKTICTTLEVLPGADGDKAGFVLARVLH
jgi:hypothetical protein